jgi:hypothetical protein
VAPSKENEDLEKTVEPKVPNRPPLPLRFMVPPFFLKGVLEEVHGRKAKLQTFSLFVVGVV